MILIKRGALHAGEVGLFVNAEPFEEDFARIKSNVDLQVVATQPRNLKQFRLAWALAGTIAKSGALGDADKEEVMEYLLKKAKHVKYIVNQHRAGTEVEVIVKSIRFTAMKQDAFDRLMNRIVYIITSEILPDMPESEFRAEVEKMAGIAPSESISGSVVDDPGKADAIGPGASASPAPSSPAAIRAAGQAPIR